MGKVFIEEIRAMQKSPVLDVEIWWCRFNSDALPQNPGYSLKVDIPEDIRRSVSKRQAEYIAGRIVARHALSFLGIVSCEVGRNQDRSPQFPKGVSGSISHTRNQALCAITLNRAVNFLGVDIEEVLSEKTANDLASQVMRVKELRLQQDCQLSFSQFITLIFSAKESVYKAIYPYIKEVIGFETSQVVKISDNHIQLILDEKIDSLLPKHAMLKCYFTVTETHVTTLLAQ
ncbi:4'-phosphopantetheinyl transferase family protein [Grimontia marina]|uniref:Enterobactin synthase component D n=1 Tax=Grimontia marina TaxID=646534 RepID=A0A128FGW6_9GAMM|nr:4'-phosphopantetheinyl transferase superfamily protein [Grimontia marina]CZF85506.1 4'-phosphopantetheinyl transferase Npt [Grimontia marina]